MVLQTCFTLNRRTATARLACGDGLLGVKLNKKADGRKVEFFEQKFGCGPSLIWIAFSFFILIASVIGAFFFNKHFIDKSTALQKENHYLNQELKFVQIENDKLRKKLTEMKTKNYKMEEMKQISTEMITENEEMNDKLTVMKTENDKLEEMKVKLTKMITENEEMNEKLTIENENLLNHLIKCRDFNYLQNGYSLSYNWCPEGQGLITILKIYGPCFSISLQKWVRKRVSNYIKKLPTNPKSCLYTKSINSKNNSIDNFFKTVLGVVVCSWSSGQRFTINQEYEILSSIGYNNNENQKMAISVLTNVLKVLVWHYEISQCHYEKLRNTN
ncbi:hypothetical protein BpHYR1_038579 [Brachionus plicatilis]|uniref:Uncharacterized protein n=1 Tax=Brachionus plicatilis TaxID=10195 RepID=A0A3M7T9I3_BRAPC|nr:hypothetical protein BpHYR1_038579 [Brachionus plicatilis]